MHRRSRSNTGSSGLTLPCLVGGRSRVYTCLVHMTEQTTNTVCLNTDTSFSLCVLSRYTQYAMCQIMPPTATQPHSVLSYLLLHVLLPTRLRRRAVLPRVGECFS